MCTRARVCVCVWCVHTHMCVCVRSGLLSCSHCPFLNRRPGGASVPVHVAISYLRRNYPWCVRFIWDESYKDNFFLSIKSCLSGLAEPHDEFHRDACINPLGSPAWLWAESLQGLMLGDHCSNLQEPSGGAKIGQGPPSSLVPSRPAFVMGVCHE